MHVSTVRSAMSVVRRWARDPQAVLDVVLAAVVAVLSIADVAASSADESADRATDALAYTLVLVGSASLIWRRRAPLATLAVVTAVLVAMYLRDYGAFLSVLGLPALYAVAAHEDDRRKAWVAMITSAVVLMLAASVSLLDTDEGFNYFASVSMLAFLVGAIAAGVIIRNRERIFVDTERRAAAAEADRLAEAERAVADERSRIAREMHDVVAHSMSVIAVQAAAGREIVHANPDKAAEVFARIEGVGRESLAELRRMLGVLRGTDDQDASLAPQPGIADVAAAVADSTASGVATELTIDGRQRPLAPGVELAAYRIVQEALTNVRKHAGRTASATVRITYQPEALVVDITDDGRGAATSLASAGSGQGLIGMRERVEIYGGELTSGPRPGGGYGIHAVLPIVEQAVASPAATQGREAETVSDRGM
jgi:signal transduction histidine kinase